MSRSIDIAALRAKAEAASPGPWATTLQWIYQAEKTGMDSLIITTLSDANAEYVAAFDPPTVLALLEIAERAATQEFGGRDA